MLGPKGGMATRLERRLSTPTRPVKLYKTWCAAHRLEIVVSFSFYTNICVHNIPTTLISISIKLQVKDAIKAFPQHDQFKEDINKLGKKSLLYLQI